MIRIVYGIRLVVSIILSILAIFQSKAAPTRIQVLASNSPNGLLIWPSNFLTASIIQGNNVTLTPTNIGSEGWGLIISATLVGGAATLQDITNGIVSWGLTNDGAALYAYGTSNLLYIVSSNIAVNYAISITNNNEILRTNRILAADSKIVIHQDGIGNVLVSNALSSSGGITNIDSVVSNAYNIIYFTNDYQALFKQLSNGANITITDYGTHLVLSASGGGSGLTTNENQFLGIPLSIKTTARVTNLISYSDGAIIPALIITNAYVTSNDSHDLFSAYNANRAGIKVNASNGVLSVRGYQVGGGNTQAVVYFDNAGGSGQTYTYWRYNGLDSFGMRCDSSGNGVFSSIPSGGAIYFGPDGGSGIVYFNKAGVGTLLTLNSNAHLIGSALAGNFRSSISNFWEAYFRSNVFISKTNFVSYIVVSNRADITNLYVYPGIYFPGGLVQTNVTTNVTVMAGTGPVTVDTNITGTNVIFTINVSPSSGALTNLSDVVTNFVSLADGHVLQYNATLGKWSNGVVVGGSYNRSNSPSWYAAGANWGYPTQVIFNVAGNVQITASKPADILTLEFGEVNAVLTITNDKLVNLQSNPYTGYTNDYVNGNIIYVSPNASGVGIKGRVDKPYGLTNAIATAVNNDTIIIAAGIYTNLHSMLSGGISAPTFTLANKTNIKILGQDNPIIYCPTSMCVFMTHDCKDITYSGFEIRGDKTNSVCYMMLSNYVQAGQVFATFESYQNENLIYDKLVMADLCGSGIYSGQWPAGWYETNGCEVRICTFRNIGIYTVSGYVTAAVRPSCGWTIHFNLFERCRYGVYAMPYNGGSGTSPPGLAMQIDQNQFRDCNEAGIYMYPYPIATRILDNTFIRQTNLSISLMLAADGDNAAIMGSSLGYPNYILIQGNTMIGGLDSINDKIGAGDYYCTNARITGNTMVKMLRDSIRCNQSWWGLDIVGNSLDPYYYGWLQAGKCINSKFRNNIITDFDKAPPAGMGFGAVDFKLSTGVTNVDITGNFFDAYGASGFERFRAIVLRESEGTTQTCYNVKIGDNRYEGVIMPEYYGSGNSNSVRRSDINYLYKSNFNAIGWMLPQIGTNNGTSGPQTNWIPWIKWINGDAEAGFYFPYMTAATNTITLYGTLNAAQVQYLMPTVTVVGANSNQTVWLGTTNTVDMLLSTNVTFTNYSGLAAGYSATYCLFLKVTNAAGNLGVNWGTLGAPGYGTRIYTNTYSPMWTTLTNTKTYCVTWTSRGTNIHTRISLEE